MSRCASGVVAASLALLAFTIALRAQPSTTVPPELAYLVIDLRSGRVTASQRAELLDRAVAPGSLMKVVTLAAAAEKGLVTRDTRVACTRRLTVDGRDVSCSHPPFSAPVDPVTALAQSCNVFFATIARRLSPADLSAMSVKLGVGPIQPGADRVGAALGLGGVRVPPRRWPDVLLRVTGDRAVVSSTTRALVSEGLRVAARTGTAAALAANGVDALAKTGTVLDETGQARGLVVVLGPSARPERAVVAMGANAAGRDVATFVPALLRNNGEGASSPRSSAPSLPAAAPAPSAAGNETIRMGVAGRRGYKVTTLPIDEYIAGIVTGEAPPRAPQALYEAMAVVARTYALGNRRRHAAEGFELCDLTHCQVWRPPTAAARAAARATSGIVLRYDGAIATVFHSASCGGRLEAADELWSRNGEGPWPYLRARLDPVGHDPDAWENTIDAPALVKVLKSVGLRGSRLRGIRIASRTSSGRAKFIEVEGFTPDTIDANDLRLAIGRVLGWQLVRSTWFEIRQTGSGVRFSGRGFGHGVGLCVAGGLKMAQDGESWQAILATYFPGTTGDGPSSRVGAAASRIAARSSGESAAPVGPLGSRAAEPAATFDLQLTLPTEVESSRVRISRMLRAAVADLAQRSSTSTLTSLTVRVHPTIESYQRATGQPWWTSAATAGTRIETIPLQPLERRGVLERTLRHEVAHVLLGPALAGRPRWQHEGAVLALTGELGVVAPADAGSACPTDADFRSARDGDSLERAYVTALRCWNREEADRRRR